MMNKNKIILDLCGGTGAWSQPYKDAGYDVRIITLPENDIMTYVPPDNVYGILAAPPCQMFSLARQDKTAKKKRSFEEGMELVNVCLNMIWYCRYKNKLAFWALENPVGYLRQFLGIPLFTFKAYEYGDLWVKPTDIWGYFKLPAKHPVEGLFEQLIDRNIIQTTKRTVAERAITPPGFAKAFFNANK